jgi:hypothetical protein
MSALWTLAGCAVLPPIVLQALRGWFGVARGASEEQKTRALEQSGRATLIAAAIGLPLAAVAGALFVPEVLSTRWPAAGAWFFAGVCATLAWSSLALSHRGREESEAMPALEAVGRVTQMVTVPSLAVAFSLLVTTATTSLVPVVPRAQTILAALASVFGLVVVGPWLAMQLGLWRLLPLRIRTEGREWRVAHLPVPSPFVAHAAALPWLNTVAVTDGLFTRVPDSHWRSLVHYEIGGGSPRSLERFARWAVAVVMSATLFVLANRIGEDDPRKLVAGTVLAVVFTGAASWFANRESASTLAIDPNGPSMQELAQTLRSLPPPHGQALPPTSHRPVGVGLYDRLFALGHDPGRRRRA